MSVKIEITIEELQKKKIFVTTPMYGGQCSGMYAKSTADLSTLAAKYDLDLKYYYLFNESLIPRARNYLVDEFLRSGYTHMMFIDSDIGFDANDVLALAAMCDEKHEVICGPYPKKCISWEKIKTAVDKGFADKDPSQLERFVGDFVFNPAPGVQEIRLDEPVEVLEAGTGFMMIRREVFEKYAKAYPEYAYRPDHVRTAAFDGSRDIHAYFHCDIDDKNARMYREVEEFIRRNPDAIPADILKFIGDERTSVTGEVFSKRYLSEDYMFCQWARAIGVKIFLCPWMNLHHVGAHVYSGSLIDLAQIGVSATADHTKLGKKS